MREDMFKVIVERPRWGSRARAANHAIDLDDEASARETTGQRDRDRCKSLNENLSPLERWLGRQVNRPWDKVYAELCARIDRRSTVQQHILQHLEDFVAIRVIEIDGELHVASHGGPLPLDARWGRWELYVDPRTGILRRNRKAIAKRVQSRREHVRRKFPGVPADRRDLAPDRQLHRLGGVWYEVTLAPIPPRAEGLRKWIAPPFDVVLHCNAHAFAYDPQRGSANWRQYGTCDRYAVRKRQLGHAELARHGLHNEE
jgi:hypothetical protein